MDGIVVVDFGGQYSHLIARRVRDLGARVHIVHTDTPLEQLEDAEGIVLSGGAASVYGSGSPHIDAGVLELGVPVLGICYGHQLVAQLAGGRVAPGKTGEYGTAELRVRGGRLLEGLSAREEVWMNHRDRVEAPPPGFRVTASTETCPVAAFEDASRHIYGVQFHPEVTHTPCGKRILDNFLELCGAGRGEAEPRAEALVADARRVLGGSRAIIGLSGGVDSSVAAALVGEAIGDRLTAVYVDTGLMRQGETGEIRRAFSGRLRLRVVDASDRFFAALAGVTDPEEKRKAIGRTFIEVFEEVAEAEGAEVLVQGTIYSDRIESGLTAHSDNIKSHHNVGGLPREMGLRVYEPLAQLYKDEVRQLARQLGLPDSIVNRQVFPGPGLGIRVLGGVTPERVETARQASAIVEQEVERAGLAGGLWMYFAVLLPVRTVGVQGDARSYSNAVAVRAVESKDAMTANFARLPWGLLDTIASRIANEVDGVNRVVYDVSNKPPATMEWE